MKLLAQSQDTFNFTESVQNSTTFGGITGGGFTLANMLDVSIKFLFIAVTISSFLYLLLGSVQWIMAGGDKDGVEKARKKITNALIGLAIAFSVYVIASLVNAIFGVDILNDLVIPRL